MKNIFKQEKFIPRLTFNPGLALTGFRTTRPSLLYSRTPIIRPPSGEMNYGCLKGVGCLMEVETIKKAIIGTFTAGHLTEVAI